MGTLEDGSILDDIESLTTACLVANDNMFVLNSVKKMLRKHFDQVDAVENGLDAVRAVKDHHLGYYKAIILDIDMPVMCGDAACLEI